MRRFPFIHLQSVGFQALAFTTCFGLIIGSMAPAASVYTIENGSMALSGSALHGWDASSGQGRENGPYNGTVAHQAIDASSDPNPGSGSLVFTATNAAGSLSQDTLTTACGQTISVSAYVARDAGWTELWFGFYDYSGYDCISGASIDIVSQVPPDADGTLDAFYPVSVTATLPSTGVLVRIIIGSTCGGFNGGSVGAKFALDNVQTTALSKVDDWQLIR